MDVSDDNLIVLEAVFKVMVCEEHSSGSIHKCIDILSACCHCYVLVNSMAQNNFLFWVEYIMSMNGLQRVQPVAYSTVI